MEILDAQEAFESAIRTGEMTGADAENLMYMYSIRFKSATGAPIRSTGTQSLVMDYFKDRDTRDYRMVKRVI